MNNKKTYNEVLNERGKDLKTLIEYFSVTRVLRCKNYADRLGGFSFKKFFSQRKLLIDWKNKNTSKHYRKQHARDFVIYQKTYNETLGIPRGLIQDVLGKYEPERKWISFDDALNTIGGEAKWKVIGHGHRVHTDKEKNVREIKESFCRKIYPENPHRWNEMLKDSRYGHLETIPDASERAIRIIRAWESSRKLVALVKSGETTIDNIRDRMVANGLDKKSIRKIVTILKREVKA